MIVCLEMLDTPPPSKTPVIFINQFSWFYCSKHIQNIYTTTNPDQAVTKDEGTKSVNASFITLTQTLFVSQAADLVHFHRQQKVLTFCSHQFAAASCGIPVLMRTSIMACEHF